MRSARKGSAKQLQIMLLPLPCFTCFIQDVVLRTLSLLYYLCQNVAVWQEELDPTAGPVETELNLKCSFIALTYNQNRQNYNKLRN